MRKGADNRLATAPSTTVFSHGDMMENGSTELCQDLDSDVGRSGVLHACQEALPRSASWQAGARETLIAVCGPKANNRVSTGSKVVLRLPSWADLSSYLSEWGFCS
jgi:hypothetical protein